MNMSTIQAAAHRHGLATSTARLTSGNTGLFISTERIDEHGRARPADARSVSSMIKYLNRYNVPFQWRGYYTSLLIIQ